MLIIAIRLYVYLELSYHKLWLSGSNFVMASFGFIDRFLGFVSIKFLFIPRIIRSSLLFTNCTMVFSILLLAGQFLSTSNSMML